MMEVSLDAEGGGEVRLEKICTEIKARMMETIKDELKKTRIKSVNEEYK